MRRLLVLLLAALLSTSAFAATGPVPSAARSRLIKVLLADVQRLPEIPQEAIDHSRAGPIHTDRELLATGSELDRRFSTGQPIMRTIDGTVVATLWDEAKDRWMAAGFEFVTHAGRPPEKEPLLHLVEPDHGGASLACDFEFGAQSEGAGLTLREVVAIDAERIYLAAESRGKPVFLSARYSFQKTFAQS